MPSVYSRLLLALAFALAACGDQAATPDAGTHLCADGIDNDADGTIDFPDDLGCVDADDDTEDSAPMPACSDNRDNDSDGWIDYPVDPGCAVPQQDTETDDCPDGPSCPQCADGDDNDNNGSMDYPDDPGCTAAGDGIEFTDNQIACGAGLTISQLPASGTMTDVLVAGTSVSNIASPCGGGGNVAARAYVFQVTAPTVIVASTADSATTFDTVLDLRSAMCEDASAEVACHDDVSTSNKASTITKPIGPGTYYLIVSGKTTAAVGTFVLNVDLLPGEGQPCAIADDCGPGLTCRVPVGETDMICTGPICNDGRDDDGDGKIDFPVDPGCTSTTDDTEEDTCNLTPPGPTCPLCANGIDDDGDQLTDYPMDPSCVSAATNAESCVQSEPTLIATTAQTTGTTVGAVNDYRPPPGSFMGHACSTTGTHTAPDIAVQFDVPAMQTMSMKLTAPSGTLFASTHVLFDASCAGTPIDCRDLPLDMVVNNLSAGRYYVIVDGNSTASGPFVLNLAGVIGNGQSCESALAQSGAITCGTGYACSGTPGSRVCAAAACNDGMDNNGDGRMDYPGDPSCVNTSDNTEENVCPGASCPACSDTVDNDGDLLVDYPTDTGCTAASSTNEGCRETEAVVPISTPRTTGILAGAIDDHNPRCSAVNAPDRIYTLEVPTLLQSLTLDTEDSTTDTVLSFMDETCGEPSIHCDNDGGVGAGDSLITMTNVLPGSYTIAVDSATATVANITDFVLDVHGVIQPNASCEGSLFAAGVLACPSGMSCDGTPGARTCTAAQCLDGIDNNNDGTTDYPDDPGCTSPSDNVEDDVCPGASCPVCFDGVDNDNDLRIDFPADTACMSASGASESCTDTDGVMPIVLPMHAGTLVGATNDFQPVCVITAGTDVVYSLTVPVLQSLTIDTEGSAVDTALSLMNGDCAAPPIACDDDGGVGTGDSLIQRGLVPAGTYTIAVDADTTTPSTYNLNIRGVIPAGMTCETPLIDTGVLSCPLGFACSGAPGSRICAVAQCTDGIDNNGDGRTDYPNDPSCDSVSDGTEVTVCPGPNCPVCGDGLDNDSDGRTDYPSDAACTAASGSSEACFDTDTILPVTQAVHSGSFIGATNDRQSSCVTTTGVDVVYSLTVPTLQSLTIDTNNSVTDTVLTLMNGDCTLPPIACNDDDAGLGAGDSRIQRNLVLAGTYMIGVDADTATATSYNLRVHGEISPGASCENPLVDSGVLTCSAGFSCSGTPGSRTCAIAECGDGIDNNGDGRTDYPFDPSCTSTSDGSEETVCPGPACPLCGDGIDNDGDGDTDYPADTSCFDAVANNEACDQSEPIGKIADRFTTGTTVGAVDDFVPTCGSTGHSAPDVVLQLDIPTQVDSLVLNVSGFDTATTLLDSTCGTTIACSDPQVMTRTNVAPGTYYVVMEGWSTPTGDWALATSGVITSGGSCEGPLAQAGAFVCGTGQICAGTPGSRTCQVGIPICSDGMDNDGDGKMDFPADPGCASATDTIETDSCPGAGCPVCGNSIDDDVDSLTDFPMDTRCQSASFFLEDFCPIEPDVAGMIVETTTAGTFAGAANNYEQTCDTTTNNDVAYGLQLPVPVDELVIHTLGSAQTTTVVSLWPASCAAGTEIACDTGSAPGTDARAFLVVPGVPAGNYAIQVDSNSATGPTFLLTVHGTVAAGTACTSSLFDTGVLSCATGTTCTAGTCQ